MQTYFIELSYLLASILFILGLKGLSHPETAKRLRDIGAEPVGSTPAEQDAILKRQVEQFRPIIKEMRIEN